MKIPVMQNGWSIKTLSDCLESLESGGRPKGGGTVSGDIPSIGAEHLNDEGAFNFESMKFIPREYYERMSRGKIKTNDILIVKDGATTGKTSFVNNGFPFTEAAINEHVFIVRTNPQILLSQYAFYYFHSENGKIQILKDFRGSAQGGITRDFSNKVQLPVPPLPIQKQIAAILEKADAAREKRRQANQLTEQFLQSAFLEMFGDPATNPKGWEQRKFSDISHIERNSIDSTEISNDELYVGLEHIEKETGRLLGYVSVRRGDLKSNKFRFTSENVLYGKLRPYLNKVCISSIRGVCSTDILPIKAKEGVSDKYFIAYLMRHRSFVEKAASKSTGANLPRISPTILEQFELFLPPLSEQQKFAFDNLVSDAFVRKAEMAFGF